MSDGRRSQKPRLFGPLDDLRQGVSNFVAAAADGFDNLLDGGPDNDPLPFPVSQPDVSDVDSSVDSDLDSDGESTPTPTTVINTNTITTPTTSNTPTSTTTTSTSTIASNMAGGGDAAQAAPTHTTTTVHQERIYVSDFSATNATEMRQFFKTLRLSLRIKYTSQTTGPPTDQFLDQKCAEQWRGHVRTSDEAAKALTNCYADLTDWEAIQAACLDCVRGSTATDARRATMTFLRTKLPTSMTHLLMVYNCKEMVDNWLDALKTDVAYVQPGEDNITFKSLKSLLIASVTTCHLPIKAQPEFLKRTTPTDTVVQFIKNARDVADNHSIDRMGDLQVLNKDGSPFASQTVANVASGQKGGKPKGSKPETKQAATASNNDSKPDKNKQRWVSQNDTDKIPHDRCQKCTLQGHKTGDCKATKAWCPKHKCLGHSWSDCKARNKQGPAPAPSTTST